MIRKPVVAGQFYPGEPGALKKQLSEFIKTTEKKEKVLGIVSPHAGYMFSGRTAGEVYSRIEIPSRMIILGPNHTGMGVNFALMSEGSWVTPLGEVKIDSPLAQNILKAATYLEEDGGAHQSEHSIEVQLPFLQYIQPSFEFVPICLRAGTYQAYEEIAKSIAQVIRDSQKDILIIASSDMNHFESQEITKEKDQKAIDAILELDEKKLLQTIQENNISMCGYVPTTIMLLAAKLLGANKAELVRYETSGDIIGDYSQVVGYAGIIVK